MAELIIEAAERTHIWVVTHSEALITGLRRNPSAGVIELQKELGETQALDQKLLDRPVWRWID